MSDAHKNEFNQTTSIFRAVGQPRSFETPEAIWEACLRYFEWVEANPIWEHKVFSYQGGITETSIPKMRAMTQHGLCLILGISEQTWRNYGSKEGYEQFFEVVDRVNSIIYEQKFTGAAADVLNPNIIARDLGLSDKKDLTSSDGTMTPRGLDDYYDDVQEAKS